MVVEGLTLVLCGAIMEIHGKMWIKVGISNGNCG